MRLPGGGSFVLREAAWALASRAEWTSCLEMWGENSLGYVPSADLTQLSLPKLAPVTARGDEMYWRELRQRMELRAVMHVGGEPLEAMGAFYSRLLREQEEQRLPLYRRGAAELAALQATQHQDLTDLNFEQDTKRQVMASQMDSVPDRPDQPPMTPLELVHQQQVCGPRCALAAPSLRPLCTSSTHPLLRPLSAPLSAPLSPLRTPSSPVRGEQLARRHTLANDAKTALEDLAVATARRLHTFKQLQREWVIKQNGQFLLIVQAPMHLPYLRVYVHVHLPRTRRRRTTPARSVPLRIYRRRRRSTPARRCSAPCHRRTR